MIVLLRYYYLQKAMIMQYLLIDDYEIGLEDAAAVVELLHALD